MAKRIYVGNLGYDTSSMDLERLFSQFGTVRSADIIMERGTDRSKGFGFVEMSSDQEAEAAIQSLNGKEFGGRQLTVNEAKPRTERVDRGGGGYRGGRSSDW
jgi:RNA recognition motif-containing protein